MDNRELSILLTEAAELLNEGILFNKNSDKVKVDYLTKFNNPRSWNKIKNKIEYCEYTGSSLCGYPNKWRNLLSEYNKEINSIIKTILDSNNLEKDSVKILVKIGIIKKKYSDKIQDFVKEIDSNTEWSKSESSTDDIGLFIDDLFDMNKCLMNLVYFNKDIAKKAKEDAIVRKFDSDITSTTELLYGEIIPKICHSIKIAHK